MTGIAEDNIVAASESAQQLKTIHVVFKTHLDIGFTDYARNVVTQYHEGFIPQALATAEALRERGGDERMIWTTGSWLIYEHLKQAAPEARQRMEAAIAAGDIVWHGLPFTTHTELIDPSLFASGLSLSAELDRRFGRHTIAGKMTDVPGHTRGIVPLLASAGIQFLHIGVNPASQTPDVPPVFVWRDPSGADVVVMYHRGSYGDLMLVPGLEDAIYFAHTADNLGPQSPEQVIEVFEILRAKFPGAHVVASTIDAFAHTLLAIKDQLPVIRQELGDTWIHGAGSDPLRISHFRELQRLRSAWLASGAVRADDPAIMAFSQQLIMVPEHTWGLDEKIFLGDEETYAAERFRPARPTGKFRALEESWEEQSAYLDAALAALDGTPQGAEARAALAALAALAPDLAGFTRVDDPAAVIETKHFRIGFDTQTGAIAHLEAKANGHVWADSAHPLARVGYQVFGEADYDRFLGQYLINLDTTSWWALQDFGKVGLGTALKQGRAWEPSLAALYHATDDAGHRFVAEIRLPEESSERYGAPRRITIEIALPNATPDAQIALQWFDKPVCRIPEAIWLAFVPKTTNPYGWRLDKLGEPIEPHEVIRNGNRKLHAVGVGAKYRDTTGSFALETLDAPLVAPGEPSLLDFNNEQPPVERGMHVNLFNNVWGTNFRMWYDRDTRFRFVLTCAE